MRPGDPTDPLLRQVLPSTAELDRAEGFVEDPLRERGLDSSGGVLRKYRGRALLMVTGTCAVHCRYCFRRHFPYDATSTLRAGWDAAEAAVAADRDVDEVILSGGDPLTLDDRALAELVAQLAEIPHLRRLRVHSRLPVVLPQRVDGALLGWLAGTRLRPVMVIHANHSAEIDDDVRAAAAAMRDAGVWVLNQSVLLAGVNDDVAALRDLSLALFEADVVPYYLHLLDPVAGAAHFDVPAGRARRLLRALAAALPGYLVPRLVREVPGEVAKVPITWGSET